MGASGVPARSVAVLLDSREAHLRQSMGCLNASLPAEAGLAVKAGVRAVSAVQGNGQPFMAQIAPLSAAA